ncbi:MAG: hypothetical protein WBG71_01425 [Leeuwenhoekiella sp.]
MCAAWLDFSASTHDHTLEIPRTNGGSYVVYNSGYVDGGQNQNWTLKGEYSVTEQKYNFHYIGIEKFNNRDTTRDAVPKEKKLTYTEKWRGVFIEEDNLPVHQKLYEFITNNYELDADKIAITSKN